MSNLTQQERERCEGKPKRRKPRKRTVYVVTAGYHYQSTHMIGAYSTKRRAERAWAACAIGYDWYEVSPHVVDA